MNNASLHAREAAETAINRDDAASHEACLVACKETDDAVKLADIAEASHWSLVEHLVATLCE